MKILLTGASGQVGQELCRLLASDPAVELWACDRTAIDLSQPSAISTQVASFKPEVIINAAAYTAVDKAENEPELAYAINAKAPECLAQAANQLGASLIHISTDYVFDGQQCVPYREEDICNPLGCYGRTKLAGERLVLQECSRSLILRTAWVHGASGRGNFVKTMLRLGQDKEQLRVVYDQVGTPTWSQDIAQAIVNLIPLLGEDMYGIYHFTNSGVTSWYDFAIAIFETAEQLGFSLKLKQVEPITTAEFPSPVQRPAYSVLGCEKIAGILGAKAPYWRDSLRSMLTELYGKVI
ncbi:dTDP-4-dehydrorhamnose reductase [Nodosilinea sp. LEGE 07088]|uniref:dTDP-4-dehydrorhamnose reductase n=1 Tax=Nodosilinea sp. LEGE 07088 TaxID=2777968 RepID=UPI00187DECE8|nr:dTDP-4-dehydrorhamnose reductase [Nodosilinea sp. LEGE 07088]MBE9135875.1 dTDP-4-dehydrorhamnose reductase [Nodosilinea sp. LEGE 07088]